MIRKKWMTQAITKLLDRVEATYIKHFTNGNRKKGLNTLRPKAKRENHKVSASLGTDNDSKNL